MRNRTVFVLTALALLGWALVVVLLFTSDWLQPEPDTPPWHPRDAPANIEGPPVIDLWQLRSRGFDTGSIRAMEPHFHVLNAALVTIVELKREYEQTSSALNRDRLLGEAVHFHTTADMHEELIERLLDEELRERFHAYVREREAAVGLHGDTLWHRHNDPAHRGVSPGFETPRRGH